MDGVTTKNELERDVEAVMRDQGVKRAVAQALLGVQYGEVFGDGDLV